MKVDIVTVSHGSGTPGASYLAALRVVDLDEVAAHFYLVDNGSSDDAIDLVRRELPKLPFTSEIIEAGENLGFSGGCNLGASQGNGEYILFLNPDTRLEPDMIQRLVERAEAEKEAGLVEAAQYPRELKKVFDSTGATDWCSGAALLARREAFEGIGGFDDLFYPAYCEDVDLSWRMWLSGWRCVYEPQARVWHDAPPVGEVKPLEQRLSTKHSFPMHFIYDTLTGLASHILKGMRYALSPKTERMRRKGVLQGLWMLIAKFGPLLNRRRWAQRKMKENPSACEHIVFTEWYYGRWQTPDDDTAQGSQTITR